jgi:hypothetical protein
MGFIILDKTVFYLNQKFRKELPASNFKSISNYTYLAAIIKEVGEVY